jgi:L-serine kinase (ADP)
MKQEPQIELVATDRLRPIEGHSRKRVRWLVEKITRESLWTRPLCVERNHLLVLDGMHRLHAAREMGLALVPCALFDYADVEVWSLRDNHVVTRERVVEQAIAGTIYPYKTAKHRFPGVIAPLSVSVDSLRRAARDEGACAR